MKKKYYSRKITAMGERYSLACYEFVEINKKDLTGQIKNHFNGAINKYLQGGITTDTLRFKPKEIANQFQ